MFRIIRVLLALDTFFEPLDDRFHWNHLSYFRLLVVVIAGIGDGGMSPTSIGLWTSRTTGRVLTTSS
jgi:hypothetical protein